MCKILLSINPEHVEHIMDGTKKYEFRKTKCKEDVDEIVIYETAPTKKVVAEVTVEEVLEDVPSVIWEKTKDYSGISRDFFFDYYSGKARAVAYKLSDLRKFDEPKSLESYGLTAAPQSFVYVN